ncbi:hypothetical protein Glove_645g10 [Diversispora epigaea]|uniref:Uncharacterized protein n=1 Tax=Diversispora epigaea TaxID=1348612 RepID=A0A397GCN9_9GLOM|nr:hypothetical protein Glove_645g10 [Diversispora epigaea]
MTTYQGLYIPVRGPPEVKTFNASFDKICHLLQCSRDWHITIYGLRDFNLALLYDNACVKCLPKNPLASRLIYQFTGQDNLSPILGLALLVDNRRRLTLNDFRYFLKRLFDKEGIAELVSRHIENSDKKMSELKKFYMELHIKNPPSGTIIRTGTY